MEAGHSQILRQSLIFSGLGQDELEQLSGLTGERSLKAGEFVFWEGDPPGYFYVLISGRIKVIKHASSGKEIIIAFFGPGEIFGEVAVFENKPYPASAQAAVDTSVLAIKKERFIDFLSRHPGVVLGIIGVLSGRLRDAQSRLKDLSGERVEQRLARTLYRLYSKLGTILPFTRQEIADMSGTTTETAIRIMSQFKERGITSSVRGRIVIVDAEKLRLLGEGPPQI